MFVDLTADWCVTCKANKLGVLLREPIYSKLLSDNIVPMRGDWTVPSNKVTTFLQDHGRFGVPFNIVYGPNAPTGILLIWLQLPKTYQSIYGSFLYLKFCIAH